VPGKGTTSLIAQSDNTAARHSNATTNRVDPLSKGYWTRERIQWLEEAVTDNNDVYADYLQSNRRIYSYQSSTSDLVRRLKGLPEWAGLNAGQAHRAIVIGLARLRRDGNDIWDLLPTNQLNCLSAEDDFLAGWEQLRRGSNRDALWDAVVKAKSSPIDWNEEVRDRLSPITSKYKLFCDVCTYLQSTVGSDGYILLPQYQLAALLDMKQSGISSFCQRAERAGFLQKVDGTYSQREGRAIRWRCLVTWCRPEV